MAVEPNRPTNVEPIPIKSCCCPIADEMSRVTKLETNPVSTNAPPITATQPPSGRITMSSATNASPSTTAINSHHSANPTNAGAPTRSRSAMIASDPKIPNPGVNASSTNATSSTTINPIRTGHVVRNRTKLSDHDSSYRVTVVAPNHAAISCSFAARPFANPKAIASSG